MANLMAGIHAITLPNQDGLIGEIIVNERDHDLEIKTLPRDPTEIPPTAQTLPTKLCQHLIPSDPSSSPDSTSSFAGRGSNPAPVAAIRLDASNTACH